MPEQDQYPVVDPQPDTMTQATHEAADKPIKRKGKLKRARSLSIDTAKVVRQVLQDYDQDLLDRTAWNDLRLQRYAKFRGWMEPRDYPWPNASNVHVPILTQNSLRTQDTLFNAVMASRPCVTPKAVRKADAAKEDTIANITDHQFFVEQNGEEKLGDWIDGFVNDGVAVAFIPHIRDEREVSEVRYFTGIAEDEYENHVIKSMLDIFPEAAMTKTGDSFWSWEVTGEDEDKREYTAAVEWYTDEVDRLQVVITRRMKVFDGPCFLPKTLEEVIVPSRCSNLQAPGPSNPTGAPHVTLYDTPLKDEIRRLQKSGYYDLIDSKDVEAICGGQSAETLQQQHEDVQQAKVQKDLMAGQTHGTADSATQSITRLIQFRRWDVDDDGLDEDVVCWVAKESKKLLRMRLLTEAFPSYPPRRPFAEAHFLPVPGQFYSIGLLELLEATHDLVKATLDQAMDKNTLGSTPWGVYRAASGIKPEVLRMGPGELYPVQNPQQDVAFPSLPNMDQAFTVNMLGILQQWSERESMQGELQFGRVPYGKASALRTASTTNNILQQGDARPERILRRFFRGLSEAFAQFHELNQAFLSPHKQYRLADPKPNEDPYRTLDDPSKIKGRFQFEFTANVLNTNKAFQSQIMDQLAGMLINGMTMQLGLVTPTEVYNVLRDAVKAKGQDPAKYLKPPSPDADQPKLMAEEALAAIVNGQLPEGMPQEGATVHLQRIQQIMEQDAKVQFLLADNAGSAKLLAIYIQKTRQLAMQEQRQQMLAQSAQQFAGGVPAQGQGGQPMQPNEQAQVGANELLDETMPMAGGGASA